MIVSVTIWALFPVLGALRAETTPVAAFIAAGWFQGFFCSAAAAIALQIWHNGRTPFAGIRQVRVSTLLLIAAAAILNVASHLLLFSAFIVINKAAATAIYETWPLLVALFVPILLRKSKVSISRIELLYGLVGFIGLTVLSYDISLIDAGPDIAAGREWPTGIALALTASIAQAVGTSLYAKTVDRTSHLGGPVERITFLQACYCLTGSIIAIAVSALRGEFDMSLLFEFGDVTIYGMVVLLLGNVFFFVALDLSKRPTIVLLWYLTPIITLLIMFGLGISEFTIAIVVGAALIIISNILTNFPAERSLVYAITMLAIGLSAGMTFSLDLVASKAELDLVAIPAGIFAIISAFLIERAQQNKIMRADMALELLESIACDRKMEKTFRNELATNILAASREQSPRRATAILQESFKAIPNEQAELKMRFAKLAVHGRRTAAFSELLVLFALATATVVLAQFVAPDTLIGDLFVIAITVSLVFLCGSVIDRSDRSADRTLAAFVGEFFDLPPDRPRTRYSRLSLMLTLVLLAVYVIGVVAKHN